MAALGEDSGKDGGCRWAKEGSVRRGSWALTPDFLSLWLNNPQPLPTLPDQSWGLPCSYHWDLESRVW